MSYPFQLRKKKEIIETMESVTPFPRKDNGPKMLEKSCSLPIIDHLLQDVDQPTGNTDNADDTENNNEKENEVAMGYSSDNAMKYGKIRTSRSKRSAPNQKYLKRLLTQMEQGINPFKADNEEKETKEVKTGQEDQQSTSDEDVRKRAEKERRRVIDVRRRMRAKDNYDFKSFWRQGYVKLNCVQKKKKKKKKGYI
ncbi:hypothetical protein RFI_10163 [Reticulomyxa filosa]|uniref:Uncharacterized protein n=1 Tax=Reticulomyxa filosa TaxID=46433 RepID=X6NNM3_RETFI|nr:hypothetical protein RFI_10163 [Reticulomyxa filosa]|eukprot:ETO26972.1 hypothetical protein RFI_10163 [Reticulomyxa filosa]